MEIMPSEVVLRQREAVEERYLEIRDLRHGTREVIAAIDLPLTPDVPPVEIRLQAVLDRCYDEGRLGDDLDYSRPPNPPLSASPPAPLPKATRSGLGEGLGVRAGEGAVEFTR